MPAWHAICIILHWMHHHHHRMHWIRPHLIAGIGQRGTYYHTTNFLRGCESFLASAIGREPKALPLGLSGSCLWALGDRACRKSSIEHHRCHESKIGGCTCGGILTCDHMSTAMDNKFGSVRLYLRPGGEQVRRGEVGGHSSVDPRLADG
jgi:hypothetical protein